MSKETEEILIEKMNKELDILIQDASKIKKLTAVSIMVMKQPTILLFLSILSDYKRVLKENEELLEVKVSASAHNRILELEKEIKELKEKYDKDTHTLQNQLDIANADRIEKEKIIKLMSKYIADEDTTEMFCIDDENKICDDEECKKCVIRFFEDKVREENE